MGNEDLDTRKQNRDWPAQMRLTVGNPFNHAEEHQRNAFLSRDQITAPCTLELIVAFYVLVARELTMIWGYMKSAKECCRTVITIRNIGNVTSSARKGVQGPLGIHLDLPSRLLCL